MSSLLAGLEENQFFIGRVLLDQTMGAADASIWPMLVKLPM